MTVEATSRKDPDVAWLAGFFDGEGTISIMWWKQTDPRQSNMGRAVLRLMASITNADARALQYASEILTAHGLQFHYSLSHVHEKPKRNMVLQIVFVGKSRVAKFLQLVMPYLVIKREQAEQALEIIRYRSKFGQRGPDGQYLVIKLQEDATLTAMIEKLRWYKHHPVSPLDYSRVVNQPMRLVRESPETTCRTPVRDEDIVHAVS